MSQAYNCWLLTGHLTIDKSILWIYLWKLPQQNFNIVKTPKTKQKTRKGNTRKKFKNAHNFFIKVCARRKSEVGARRAPRLLFKKHLLAPDKQCRVDGVWYCWLLLGCLMVRQSREWCWGRTEMWIQTHPRPSITRRDRNVQKYFTWSYLLFYITILLME